MKEEIKINLLGFAEVLILIFAVIFTIAFYFFALIGFLYLTYRTYENGVIYF